MNKLIVFVLLIVCLPLVSAISTDQAVNAGEDFIKSNIQFGHKGMPIKEYGLNPVKMYQNDIYYKIYYEVKGSLLGTERKAYIMLIMDKFSGGIIEAYASKNAETSIFYA